LRYDRSLDIMQHEFIQTDGAGLTVIRIVDSQHDIPGVLIAGGEGGVRIGCIFALQPLVQTESLSGQDEIANQQCGKVKRKSSFSWGSLLGINQNYLISYCSDKRYGIVYTVFA